MVERGNHRREIFRDESDRMAYLNGIEHYRERSRCIVYAYVLMSNHVHLLIETGKVPLYKIMHGLQFTYTGFLLEVQQSGPSVSGYKAILCDRDTYGIYSIAAIPEISIRASAGIRPATKTVAPATCTPASTSCLAFMPTVLYSFIADMST
jgi:hypothetical protein